MGGIPEERDSVTRESNQRESCEIAKHEGDKDISKCGLEILD